MLRRLLPNIRVFLPRACWKASGPLAEDEERISERVFGQDEAVHAVAEAARRMRADLQPGRKPNSFLFVGPTGVGKTELAKALAEALFDDELRFSSR